MKTLKRWIILWMVAFMTVGMFGCMGGSKKVKAEYSALSYTQAVAVADIEAYAREVSVQGTNKKNNAPVENGIVLCPYYTLKVNGKEVPVYTTRCTNSTHSFAWIDVKGAPNDSDFYLDIELETAKKYSGVVVLPEKSGVKAELADKKVTARIEGYGDYSFVFSTDRLKTFKVTNQPLTLIVAPESSPEVPDDYAYVEIEPGRYAYDDLVLTQSNTVYAFKSGEYELRRIVASKLENIMFYFEPGTYISVFETPEIGLDQYNIGGPAFGISGCNNVRIEGRALFDFSGVRGLYKDPETGEDVDMTQ